MRTLLALLLTCAACSRAAAPSPAPTTLPPPKVAVRFDDPERVARIVAATRAREPAIVSVAYCVARASRRRQSLGVHAEHARRTRRRDPRPASSATMGGLDLRPDVAYENLIEVKATLGTQFRVMPGVPGESFLFNKLRAATEPDSVKVEGSAMPSGAPPLSADHLEALRRWIETRRSRCGACSTGTRTRSI
jgi:hypothetical protein